MGEMQRSLEEFKRKAARESVNGVREKLKTPGKPLVGDCTSGKPCMVQMFVVSSVTFLASIRSFFLTTNLEQLFRHEQIEPRFTRMGLLSFVPTSLRPVVVALLAIVVVILLLRPRNKPVRPPGEGGVHNSPGQQGTSSSSSVRLTTRGPAFSLSTVGTLLEFREGRVQLIPGAVDALRRISAVADVFLVTQLPKDTDELETASLETMARAGLFDAGACERHKTMFCSTEDGRRAMVRQLAPAIHLDTSPKVLRYLAPHLARVVYVDPTRSKIDADDPIKGSSIDSASSLAEYASIFAPTAA